MMIWMLSGLGVVVFAVVLIIRNAEADDRGRKLTTKRTLPNNWE